MAIDKPSKQAEARSPEASFKVRHRELGALIMELHIVHARNERESPEHRLPFAEALLLLVTLERFLRVIVCTERRGRQSLGDLLKTALDDGLLKPVWPATVDTRTAVGRLCAIRDTIMHGSFEQAAAQVRVPDALTYLAHKLPAEIDWLQRLLAALVAQIDPETGKPRTKGDV